MSKGDVEARVGELQGMTDYNKDSERWSRVEPPSEKEYDLFMDVFKAIASGCSNAQELAQAALQAQYVDIPR